MITEDYISFETAKLLKEKGFDIACEYQYINCSSGHPFLADIRDDAGNYYKNTEIEQDAYSAPTLQMTTKWLREVHNLHIMVDCIGAKNYKPTIQFTRDSRDIVVKSKISKIGGNGFDSHEQAIDAAIKYCLENLI